MMDRIKHLVFPSAIALNFYALTFLYIIAGFLGQTNLAAEMAIIQGGLLAVFLALSGNARNLILSSESDETVWQFLSFRAVIILPAAVVVFYLISHTIEIEPLLIIALLLRRGFEWFVEIELAERERLNDVDFAISYFFINSFGFFILIAAMIADETAFLICLFIWAFLPLFYSAMGLFNMVRERHFSYNFFWISPHIGSSAIIGVSVYFFRILIVLLAGKVLAGQLFASYAIGGLVNAVYTQALGPSLMHKSKSLNRTFILWLSLLSFILGLIIVIFTIFFSPEKFSRIFLLGVGSSLIGGAVMVLAQWNRLSILQDYKHDVFVPDALANMLLLMSVPVAYLIFGETVLAFMFLWSGLLTFMIYAPLRMRIKFENE